MSVPAAYLGVILIWSTTPLAIQWSAQGASFSFAVMARMLIGLAVCLVLLAATRTAFPFTRAARRLYVVSGLSLFASMLLTYWGALHIPSGLISVIFGLSPLVTGVFAALWLAERTLTPLRIAGLALALAGLWLIFGQPWPGDGRATLGTLATVTGMALQALGLVWIKRLSRPPSDDAGIAFVRERPGCKARAEGRGRPTMPRLATPQTGLSRANPSGRDFPGGPLRYAALEGNDPSLRAVPRGPSREVRVATLHRRSAACEVRVPSLAITTGSLGVAVPCFVLAWLIADAAQLPPDTTLRAGAAIVYLGILGSVVGFTLYYYMIKHLDAGRIALIMLVTPVSALLLGQTLNHERIPAIGWAGIALIGTGLLLYEWQALRQLRRPAIS